MTEFAPRGKRGLYGAWQSFTVALGLLAGAGIVALLSALLTPEALHDWGWRIPFSCLWGGGALVAGEYGRDAELRAAAGKPLIAQASTVATIKAIVMGIGRVMVWSAAGYTYLVIMPTYLQSALHTGFNRALLIAVISNVGFALTIIPSGILATGLAAAVMIIATALLLILALPLLKILQAESSTLAVKAIVVLIAGGLVGMLAGRGGNALRDVPDACTLYRAWSGVFLVECHFLGVCGAYYYRVD